MALSFYNGTCQPFPSTSNICLLGNLMVSSINATDAEYIMASVNFARQHNIRLVIKNTRHE
jgi:hypothetical protein